MPSSHLSTAEVAKRFGVDTRTIHRWTAEDATPRLTYLVKTPGVRGAYVFTADAVADFEAARAEDAA